MQIKRVHTLGPDGTNCAMAARVWIEKNKYKHCEVVLHDTLENAATEMSDSSEALMACIAYPKLHTLMFKNHPKLRLVDCIVVSTFEMVLAIPKGTDSALAKTVASHEAPLDLAPSELRWMEASSNAVAADMCRRHLADTCITTMQAAERNNLEIAKNFGAIEMGFSIHQVSQDEYC